MRARSASAELVARVDQGAFGEGQATAADAFGEPVPHPLKPLDTAVEFGAPTFGCSDPELVGGSFAFGQQCEHVADDRQRDAQMVRGSDEGDPPEGLSAVAALVSGRASAVDEPLPLVEAKGGRWNAAAVGQLTNGELGGGRGYWCHEATLA